MDVCTPLVANNESAKPMKPGERALDYPTVSPQTIARLDPSPSDSGRDAADSACGTASHVIIGLVGMQLVRTPSATTLCRTNGWNAIEQFIEWLGIVDVGRGQLREKRDPLPLDDDVVLGARSAPIGRVRAGFFAPLFAGTFEASSETRDQSMRSHSPNSSRKARCNLSHTPAACQSRSRRQQVIPLPQPISLGSASH